MAKSREICKSSLKFLIVPQSKEVLHTTTQATMTGVRRGGGHGHTSQLTAPVAKAGKTWAPSSIESSLGNKYTSQSPKQHKLLKEETNEQMTESNSLSEFEVHSGRDRVQLHFLWLALHANFCRQVWLCGVISIHRGDRNTADWVLTVGRPKRA